jgi:hypothetical protein
MTSVPDWPGEHLTELEPTELKRKEMELPLSQITTAVRAKKKKRLKTLAETHSERLVLVSLLNPNHTKPSLTKAGLEQAIKKSPELKLIWQNLIKSKGKIDAKKAEALACRTIVSSLRKDQLKREKEARKKPEK